MGISDTLILDLIRTDIMITTTTKNNAMCLYPVRSNIKVDRFLRYQVWLLWYVKLVHTPKLVALFSTKFGGGLDISQWILWNILEMNNHFVTSERVRSQSKLTTLYVASSVINFGIYCRTLRGNITSFIGFLSSDLEQIIHTIHVCKLIVLPKQIIVAVM